MGAFKGLPFRLRGFRPARRETTWSPATGKQPAMTQLYGVI